MRDRIQTWASIVLGLAVVALVGWLTSEQMTRSNVRAEPRDGGPSASASASASAGTTAAPSDAGTGTGTAMGIGGGSGDIGKLDTSPDGGFGLGSLGTLLDSGAMPTSAPRTVRLGVVLVHWAGAEGAPASARSKQDALKRAQELVEQAKGDWKATVKAGDQGSSEDIGRIPRGVLDARTELAVFSMTKDDISEPLETSKGYWIVKRID